MITSVHHAGLTIPRTARRKYPRRRLSDNRQQPRHLYAAHAGAALDAIRSAGKPIIAIKPMAGGRFLGEQAFDYVFNEVGVSASMFGMGTLEQVRQTTGAARAVLGLN